MNKSHKKISIYTQHEFKKIKENKTFLYVNDIKETLKFNKQNYNGKKKELLIRLDHFFNSVNEHNNINNIDLRGPSIDNLDNITNKEDFYTLIDLTDINKEYLFTYKIDKFIYGFDIRSFKKLIGNNLDSTNYNPYNRELISSEVIDRFNKRIDELTNKNININYENDLITPEQEFKNKVVSTFQKIDELNVLAGGTHPNWFINLNLIELKKLYKVLEDIWNYRAELTNTKKLEIIPNNDVFKHSMEYIFNIYDIHKLQTIILDNIIKLISSSDNISHKATGAYYVLIAFTEISPIIADQLPWLMQY